MSENLFESEETNKEVGTADWWNIDGIKEKIRQTLPPELAGLKIPWSQLGTGWSNSGWKNIQASYPERKKNINGSLGYSYPPETLGIFLEKWLPDYWKELEKQFANGSKVFPVELPKVATRTNCVFAGAKICFSGFSNDEKAVLTGLSAQLGIEIKEDVTESLDYLVLGTPRESSKIETAISLKKCIVPLRYFVKLIS